MLEIIARDILHVGAVYTRNTVLEIIDAVDVENADRKGLVYFLQILAPVAFQSAEYTVMKTLSGHERPPVEFSGSLQYPGWQVNIEDYLDALVEWAAPFGSDQGAVGFDSDQPPGSVAPVFETQCVSPYKLISWAERDGTEVAGSRTESGVKYAIKGGLGELEEKGYSDYNSAYKDTHRQWLTRKPDYSKVGRDAPEVLSFLVNSMPKPAALNLRAELVYNDGYRELVTLNTISTVVMWGVLICDVGVKNLNLQTYEAARTPTDPIKPNWNKLHSYIIYLTNENNEIITAKRTYVIDYTNYKEELVLAVTNTLGGVDSFRFTGAKTETGTATAEVIERVQNGRSESKVVRKEATRELEVMTGLLPTKATVAWMEELTWAEEIALIYDKRKNGLAGYSQKMILKDAPLTRETAAGLGEFSFSFTPALKATGSNTLPYRAETRQRPVMWLPEGNYCLVNESGFKTGLLGAARLRMVYADTAVLEPVKGVSTKANTPGTEGYVPPVLNSSCVAGTATVTNTAISRMGTHKKQGCGAGFMGIETLITVPEGLYGGNNLKEANDLAELEWKRRDTQAAADANTSGCISAPENYTATVRPGMVMFRFNVMRNETAYQFNSVSKSDSTSTETKGNAWWCWDKSTADVYLSGTNNVEIPAAFAPGTEWKFHAYDRRDGKTQRLTVYKNGVQAGSVTGKDFFGLHLPHATFAAGDRVYIKIELAE